MIFLLGGALVYWLGKLEADADRARLQLIWPDVMSLAPRDQALLLMLSEQCSLNHVPREAHAVVTRLRDAAARPNVITPRGVTNAREDLDRLLHRARWWPEELSR